MSSQINVYYALYFYLQQIIKTAQILTKTKHIWTHLKHDIFLILFKILYGFLVNNYEFLKNVIDVVAVYKLKSFGQKYKAYFITFYESFQWKQKKLIQ